MYILNEDTDFSSERITLPRAKYPVGHYMAWVHPDNTKLGMTKSKKKCIIWELEICGPSHIGVVIYKWSMLEGSAVSYTKGDFFSLGITVNNMSDVKRELRKIRNSVLNVEIIDNGNFYNVEFLSKTEPDQINMDRFSYYNNIFWKRT
jgi:hypothetical protein